MVNVAPSGRCEVVRSRRALDVLAPPCAARWWTLGTALGPACGVDRSFRDGLRKGPPIFYDASGWQAGLGAGGRRAPPDVLASEIALPGPSALDLLLRLRQRDRVPAVILIASEGEDGERAQACGADLVLPWPLDIDQLRTAVTVTA